MVQDDHVTLDAVVVAPVAAPDDEPLAKRPKLAATRGASVSYVGHTPTQRGKFLIQKALALGVPKGPLCGALHRGQDVTISVDGKDVVVTSADCVEPSLPGTKLLLSCFDEFSPSLDLYILYLGYPWVSFLRVC